MDGRKEEMIEGGKECETKVGRRKEEGRKEGKNSSFLPSFHPVFLFF